MPPSFGHSELALGLDAGTRITDEEFQLFQNLVLRDVGIQLTEAKKALLVRRLSGRLRDLGLGSFAAYYKLVTSRQGTVEYQRMLDRISTHETRFFREPRQFDYLINQVVPEWITQAERGARGRRIRVWSAACSTGEEPYSVAMVLRQWLPAEEGWSVDVLATDLSKRTVEEARKAIWPIEKVEEIPEGLRRPFLLKGTGEHADKMRIAPEIRQMVRFDTINLNETPYELGGPFDLVLCRNVLIYFSAEAKRRVLDNVLNQLTPTGYLFVGHAECATSLTNRILSARPTIYRLRMTEQVR